MVMTQKIPFFELCHFKSKGAIYFQ